MQLVHDTRPIKVHAFPFSPRPGTPAADMPNQVPREISKQRVKDISDAAGRLRTEFMTTQVGKTVQVLVEQNNSARDPHDICVKIIGAKIPARSVCNIVVTNIKDDAFVGTAG